MTQKVRNYYSANPAFYANRNYRFGDLAKQSIANDVWYSVDSYGVVRAHSWSSAGMAA